MSCVMGDPKTVLEGSVKYRDKKKWKSRWAVVSKLSPVADCLHIQLYRDSKERCKNGPTKASLSLEDFLGLETGFTLDKESNTLAIICSELVVVLAFDNRELLIQWQVKIRANLVEEQQFLVQIAHVPPKSKLPCGPCRLHLQDYTFCLVSGVPPRLLGTWPIKELRRFGVVEGKFCFEGGSLCGKGEGLHVLHTNQCEELSQAMDLASKGKLQGKRKTLSRKNSMLETSTRMPLHKRCHLDSSKGSDHPTMSSGSEGSTCDACSEILRPSDDMMYSSSACSMKASSCRIHYRWPSCLSRWGQSSTTTASDVDSVDTVSIILSDFQGAPHSATMSKANGHGQSLSCLCDSQGTWPFNQCSKCGRQFYSRGSLQNSKGKTSPSPENTGNDDTSGFSPQWTMDSLIGSTNCNQQSKKDPAYQMMNPPSDRASLCSHASHSSSASASSESEYSVPKNFMDTLYDRPKNMQHAFNGFANCKPTETRRASTTEPPVPCQGPTDTCIVCPCHEPIKDWMTTSMSPSQEKLAGHQECACWNKLSMSVRSEVDIRMINGRKSASANASPNSSPKKTKYNTGASTLRTMNNGVLDCDFTCTCGKGDPYANYAIPRSSAVVSKDSTLAPGQSNGSKDTKTHVPDPTEDYDVPKKFTDMMSNCDMTQKNSAMKSINNGPSCSCMSACKIVQNIELFKMASKHSYNHKHGPLNPNTNDPLQMCACQRVMLWAGSLVPCLGPQSATLDTGWHCTKSLATDGANCSRTWMNHTTAVCSEPHRTTEVVMKNGKLKHVLRESSCDTTNAQTVRNPLRPRASTVSYSFSNKHSDTSYTNYANIEFPSNKFEDKSLKASDDSLSLNYANIEFAETLPLYENSNLVLSRLETDDKKEAVVPNKPPLPPRCHMNASKKFSDSMDKDEKCKCKQVSSNPNRSPKKIIDKQINGSAYEMMCYEKAPTHSQSDEDYLMMQPLCIKEDKASPSKQILEKPDSTTSNTTVSVQNDEPETEIRENLPLRPFMPYSYPIAENTNSGVPEGISGDTMSRKNQLISEDLHIRAMRSNSLSELKKKVLMRKRSSSVDGKNNGYQSKDSGVESVPASPVSSPKPSVSRKNSLFSKLNLRSKEKSMSTNEIDLPLPLPNGQPCVLNSIHKNGHHRSADCLKPNEDFTNSDEDLNSDSSDFVLQKESYLVSSMKRSSSVPCRAGMPTVSISSPVRTNETIMELNDLNKETSQNVPEGTDDSQEPVQRKYSLDSHERSKQRVSNRARSNCDNIYSQECLDESDTVMEMQGVLRRNHLHTSDRGSATDNCRSNTSSCSSSDISDYMESLSFISRSSSSSSGSTSSADYMRSEELHAYMLRQIPRPPPKNAVPGSNNIMIPAIHQNRQGSADMNGSDVANRSAKYRCLNDHYDSSSVGTSSGGSFQENYCHGKDEPQVRPCTSIRCNRDSRSSTSSTSSLSTSPSVTDYSSSTSSSPPCQTSLPPKPPFTKRKPEVKPDESAFAYPCAERDPKTK
ncbi:Protein Dok-7 like protein [Argiope bruennichi]|uniref:Protein Dok-7 like protein n=1 Tax=Argiope bruennichi TaxID=94029 RepID=A0A8T0E4Q6_ARGBR|nr:Protein Dok-7 like protein [Argiope bruennichi]